MSRPKKKANLVTGQQTLYFTQTREKPQENDASMAIEIDNTGEGREKGPNDQDVRSQTESESVPRKKTDQVTQSQLTLKQIATVLKWKAMHKWL